MTWLEAVNPVSYCSKMRIAGQIAGEYEELVKMTENAPVKTDVEILLLGIDYCGKIRWRRDYHSRLSHSPWLVAGIAEQDLKEHLEEVMNTKTRNNSTTLFPYSMPPEPSYTMTLKQRRQPLW